MVGPYSSCTDRCIVLCRSHLLGGGGSCSCMLLLQLVLTKPDAGPNETCELQLLMLQKQNGHFMKDVTRVLIHVT